MNDKSTVFVIDDDPAVRESLTLLLEQVGFSVNAFDSAMAFLDAFRAEVPDSCAIVDIRMPGMDGLQLQAELARLGSRLPIIFLTGHGDIPLSVRAIKAGAVDFLTKPVSMGVLREKVLAALQRQSVSFSRCGVCGASCQCAQILTGRERQVCAFLVKGLQNKEVARHLDISHRTVEIHRARIMKKTRSKSLIDLVHFCIRTSSCLV